MKSLIFSIAVGCSLFAFRTDAIGDMFCDSKSTTRNFCDGGDEEGIIEYDFGTKTTTYNSEFHFIASYSGKFNPVSFLIQTNLNFNFESIDDYTYSSYLLTGYSRMVTWKAPESGTYQFDLTSQFDNFLYMIDPSSSTLLKKDVDYNDDSDGTDARLTKTVTQGKTYAFICSPYNLQNSIGTNNDIVLKITVL